MLVSAIVVVVVALKVVFLCSDYEVLQACAYVYHPDILHGGVMYRNGQG